MNKREFIALLGGERNLDGAHCYLLPLIWF
jgi:hypothetical protein